MKLLYYNIYVKNNNYRGIIALALAFILIAKLFITYKDYIKILKVIFL
jgi:hypothetical protein